MATDFTVNKADLAFILRQIRIAEATSSEYGTPVSTVQAIQNEYGIDAANAAIAPFGLRTVDGRDNNLLPGQGDFGAADTLFPRLTDPVYRNEGDEAAFNGVTNTDYGLSTPGPNNVVDSDPRIISNLIVDMTAGNPAAIDAALKYSVFSGAISEDQVPAAAVAIAAAYQNRFALDAAAAQAALDQATAQANYDAAMASAADYVAAAALANASDDAAAAAQAAVSVLAGSLFVGATVDNTDIANIAAAVAAAEAAFLAAMEVVDLLAGYPELGDAQTVADNAESLRDDLIALQTAMPFGEPVEFANEISAAFDAATQAGANVTAAQDLTADLNAQTGGDVTTALADAIAASDIADAATLSAVLDSYGVGHDPLGSLVIPNLSPDIGLSPGFNAWMTFFGQFFDHGLDLVTKGGNGSVYVPLQADDPLIAGADGAFGTADDLPAYLRFMTLTRALPITVDGVTGEENTTTSFVDQNQTYTSHPSHQVFLREYMLNAAGDAVATGKMLDGSTASGSVAGAIGNWAEVKLQAKDMLGLILEDIDVLNVPLLATDQYGKFVPGDNGYAQVVMPPGTGIDPDTLLPYTHNWLLEGTAGGLVIPAEALRTNHAFLNDLAHNAVPGTMYDPDGPGGPMGLQVVQADSDTDVGNDIPIDFMGRKTAYDDELLDLHMITGDGRGNENIALTTVHSIFHSEHNRLVDVNKATIIAEGATDIAFLNEWLLVDVAAVPADTSTLVWDGERLFQAARFGTEMQYQHMVFEEFARRIQPMIDPFIFNSSPDVDPSIVAEFAHTVYRFGHSMLTGTVDRLENDLTTVNGDLDQKSLLAVFLNPQAYIGSGADLETINANIIRGLSRDVGNAMDEFIVQDVRSNLLGLPLDLAVLNLARGRETGIPSLNQTRAQLYNDTGLADLKPYESWADFALNIKNAASVVNFIAAYGTHDTITGESTLAGKRAAAEALVFGGVGAPADRLAFLNGTDAYAGGAVAGAVGTHGGLELVDLWIGGLAERNPEFGGMLGTTFNYVFEFQMESLQFGDRMYYLTRTQGTNFLNNLEPNTFSDIVMRNTALGDDYSTHLNGQLFVTPDYIIELDRGIAQTDYNGVETGNDPLGNDPILGDQIVRDYTGAAATYSGVGTHDVGGYLRVVGGNHYVLGGTEGDDRIYGDSGMDTLWGDGGNDYLNGGTEADDVFGGSGDDIIEDPFGEGDVLRGNDGNDVVTAAGGADLLFGNDGQDYIALGADAAEVFGGTGNDFILGGAGKDFLMGNEGDDWIEGGAGFDTIAGENTELFFNSPIIGHDVLFGQGDESDYDAESGDDIMGSGPSVFRYEGMFGFDWGIAKGGETAGVDFDLQIPVFTTIPEDVLRDRFDQVEALSGWKYADILDGDDRGHKGGGSSAPDSVPTQLFADHLLTQEGVDRITGFDEWFDGARDTLFGAASPIPGQTSLPATTYRDGNILMGGDGSDFLRGRGGYDLLDGDAWLNVRIKIVIPDGLYAGTYSAESMNTDTAVAGEYAGKVFNTDGGGNPIFTSPAFGGRSLTSLMLDRTINPGDLSIVREILYDTTPGDSFDTAIFQGVREEYDIEGITLQVNGNGDAPDTLSYVGTAQDLNNDGFISVRDRDTGAVGATVTRIIDGVATEVVNSSSRGALTDDLDLLKNIEMLRFADQTLVIAGNNELATGTVTISDPTPYDLDGNPATPGLVTPYVGQVLTATLSDFADADGIPIDLATGLPVGLTFQWQTTETGGNAGWAIITEGNTYTVRPVDPGHILRAVAIFKDSHGATETIISAATDGATPTFSVNENSANNTVVAATIPFNPDYDPEAQPGGPTDGDIVELTHVLVNNAGGRFQIVTVGGVQQLQVLNGALLNYEAPVHTPANLSYQFVDNQYQVVIDSYIDAASAAALDPAGRIASRQFTILLKDVEPEPIDAAPVLDLQGVVTTTTSSYREEFTTQSYTGTDQPLPANTPWTTAWTEAGGENGGATGGDIEIVAFGGSNQLRFDENTDGGENITRTVNLTGATSATLSFNWTEDDRDAGENVLVQALNVTTNAWETIGTMLGDAANGSGTASFNLTAAQMGANSAIRFQAVNGWEGGENFYIDNVNIAVSTPTVTPAAPFNYATTFTEPGTLADGTPVAIALNPAASDADGPPLMGATIKLTNAKPLDALTIAGALPVGITSTLDTSVAGVITLYLSGPATFAALQTAIGQVRFSNSSQNPDETTRVIQVTVNDGEKESNVAEALVTVDATNDPPIGVDDAIITNFVNGANFTIPEWALLANDTDVDSLTLDVTAVGGASNLTGLTLNVGSVTMAHTAAGNSSFTYTASDGAASDVATASVARSLAPTTYSETFGSTSYTDDDGAWTQNWVETDDDGSSTAANGQIRITGNHLEFDAGNNAAASNGASIQRTVNLTGATSATLSFDYDENGFDAGETVLVQFAADGTTFTTVQTINSASGSGSSNIALSGAFGANSAIRFVVSGMNTGDGDNVQIDNINVTYTSPSTNIVAGAGNQILVGDGAASSFTGGTGNDIILAGAGNDTINYVIGDGADTVDGEANTDTLAITANGGGQTLDVILTGLTITQFEGGTVTNVESVTANLGGGTDTLSYVGTTANVTVNLATSSASGFTSISNIENVTGGDGNDTLTGSSADNVLSGGLGVDVIVYNIDEDNGGNDVITGGGGTDTLAIIDTGGTDDETLSVAFNGTRITQIEGGGSVGADVESVTADLGAGTTDTLAYTAAGGVTVNLATGTASGFTSIANIENVTGDGGNDTLTGNGGANVLIGNGGADVLSGGGGDDELSGGAGVDTLTGGAGNDDFNFDDNETGVGAGNRDIILDFAGGGGAEDIDLSAIGGTFTFIGTGAITASGTNQLRYQQIDTGGPVGVDSTLIQFDIDGDTGVEGEILLQGYTGALVATDFNL